MESRFTGVGASTKESVDVGYLRCRENRLSKRRYTAVYRDVRGIERWAGTFTRRAKAERAWKSAEAAVADGRCLDVDQGRKRFADYARETWLPQLVGEDPTVQGYGFYLEKYLIPEFGATPMIEIAPGRVRAFYALLRDAGIGLNTIDRCKTVLLATSRPNATTPVAASADKSSSEAAGSLEVFAATLPAGHSNQSSREPEKCSAGSDPLTSDEQRIKKPIPSTSGDRP